MKHSIAFWIALSLAVIACGGTDGGPTAPNAPPTIPASPAPPVPPSPAPPISPAPSVAGTWMAMGIPAGLANLTIVLVEDARTGLSGRWTAISSSCSCELKGDISQHNAEPGLVFSLSYDNLPNVWDYGTIKGVLIDPDHIRGSIEISTGTETYGSGYSTIGDELTLVRVPQ